MNLHKKGGKKMGTWRDNIRRVEPYTPGEQPKSQNVIKLNTNENPYPPAPGVLRAMEDLPVNLLRKYPDALSRRYQVEGLTDTQSVLEAIAAQRGALKSGGIADLDKACALLLDDFRSLRLGRITLEEPDDLIF